MSPQVSPRGFGGRTTPPQYAKLASWRWDQKEIDNGACPPYVPPGARFAGLVVRLKSSSRREVGSQIACRTRGGGSMTRSASAAIHQSRRPVAWLLSRHAQTTRNKRPRLAVLLFGAQLCGGLLLGPALTANAALTQQWGFSVTRVTINGFAAQGTLDPSQVTVSGSFQPVVVKVPENSVCGGQVLLSFGPFNGTHATVSLTGVSGCLGNVRGTGSVALNAPFPDASRAVGSASSGPTPNIGVNFTASCFSGCSASHPGPSELAASLPPVAIM